MPTSAIRANEPNGSQIVNACAAAADELITARRLIAALETENTALHDRLETAAQVELLLQELAETHRREAQALRAAITAKNETIAAKESVIAKQDELIERLKKQKSSPWKRVGDILIGVAISAVLK